uniref:Secreted protein n=1 Tax=Denticeps clupeoides TaxID=299321 RepID=A0AAY4E9Z4_9TELE
MIVLMVVILSPLNHYVHATMSLWDILKSICDQACADVIRIRKRGKKFFPLESCHANHCVLLIVNSCTSKTLSFCDLSNPEPCQRACYIRQFPTIIT